jgi:hypothetical protein
MDCAFGTGQHTPRTTQTHGGFGVRHCVRCFLGEYFLFTYQRCHANTVFTLFGVTGMVIHNYGLFRHGFSLAGLVPMLRPMLWPIPLPNHPTPAPSLAAQNEPASAFSSRRFFLPIPGFVG